MKNGWNNGGLAFLLLQYRPNIEARPRAASLLSVDRTLSSGTWQLIFNVVPVLMSFCFLPLKRTEQDVANRRRGRRAQIVI